MLDSNQEINVTGSGNKTAGGNLIDNSITFEIASTKHSSSIENILKGISQFTLDVTYQRPDTIDYTIEDKIDHNNLTTYKTFFDDYMDNYSIVKHKIILFEESGDVTFGKRLEYYIKSKYKKNHSLDLLSDDIVGKIILDIESELKSYSELSLDDISGIQYVIFYIFAECKIFEKPPKAK